MKGWKTWGGALLIAGSTALRFFGHDEVADLAMSVGAGLGLVGIGHKIEKSSVTNASNVVPIRRGSDGKFTKVK